VSAFSIAWSFLKEELPKPPNLLDLGQQSDSDEGADFKPNLLGYHTTTATKTQAKAPADVQFPPEWKTRLAISGSRLMGNLPGKEDQHWELFDDKIAEWIAQHGMPDCIISGGAEGADQMASAWAKDNKIPLIEHKPDYKTHKYDAPSVRNKQMVDDATHILAFPSGHPDAGGGTQNTMLHAIGAGKPLHHHALERDAGEPLLEYDHSPKEEGADWFQEFMSQESPGEFATVGGREKGSKFTEEEIDEMRSRTEAQGGAKRGLEHAVRRMHGKKFAGPRGIRMREQSTADRALGQKSGKLVEGLPMHQPLKRRATRHLPQLTNEQRMQRELERMIEEGDVHPNMIDALRAAFQPEEEKQKQKDVEELIHEDLAEGQRARRGRAPLPKVRRGKGRALRNIRKPKPSKTPNLLDLGNEDDDIETGEPMDIAFQFLKGVF